MRGLERLELPAPRDALGTARAELTAVSPAGADGQWLDTLRMRQIASNASLQRSQSNPILGSPFYPYFADQDSYAAAVRRTQAPVKYQQLTPINQSRSSSPTQYGLAKSFSSLHLNSRDSGFSSLNTDSSSERGRHAHGSRNKCGRGGGALGASGRGRLGRSQPAAPWRERGPGRPQAPDPRRANDRRPPGPIPGMPLRAEPDARAGEEEGRVSEGGWTRVEPRRRPARPSPARGGKERARGGARGRRTF